ncbi:MAG: serpin family protein [Verrucomicrobia bacterium]|nr:serpin family protein [Verrucomicrobiota bacterium]
MRRFCCCVLAAALPLFGAQGGGTEEVTPLVKGINAFTLDFYKEVAKKPGNLVISPFNISTALSMVYLGARGETATQMEEVLHYGTATPEELGSRFRILLQMLQGPSGADNYRLSLANSVWFQEGESPLFLYKSLLKSNYGVALQEVNFAQPTIVAKKVNTWVSEQTQGSIDELLQDDSLNPQTKLVLVSAIYLKAPWMRPFAQIDTKEQKFHLSPTETLQVPMMHQAGRFPCMRGDGFAAIALPYQGQEKGPRLTMLLVLPDQIDHLGDVEKQITPQWFEHIVSSLSLGQVAVTLPKFRLANRVYARSLLEAMGLKAPFSPAADLSGISGQANLMVDAVIHEAYIEVDEEGTQAVAATAVSVGLKALAPLAPEMYFVADHPFLYAIMDTTTGQILFIGRVITP